MTNIQILKEKNEEEKRIFKPINEKQRDFIYSQKERLLLSGAVRAGKSYIGCWKGLLLNLKYPGNRGLICRKENTSLPESTLLTLFTQVLPQSWIISHNKTAGKIVHATPLKGVYSTIIYGGLDKKANQEYPTKIGSTTYGWVFADETIELDKGEWDMLGTRLNYKIPRYTDKQNDRVPRQLFGATNPDTPNHWLYKFFFECNEKQKKKRQVYLMTPYENPYLPKSYISGLEDSLSGVNRDRLLFGKWVSSEGVIYKAFDFSKHVVDHTKFLFEVGEDQVPKFNVRLYKQVLFAADSNFPLPRAGLMAGFRGDGSVDILDEFYRENCHVEELGKWIQDWARRRNSGILGYHDPSCPDEIKRLNNMDGVFCEKANNEVVPGISEVSRYFEKNLIRINKTCVNTIKETQTYCWKPKAEGEQPIKKQDHLMDCLRYLLNSLEHVVDRKPGRPI